MLDVDRVIERELEELAPPDPHALGEWKDVRERAGFTPKRRWHLGVVAVALAAAVAVPSIAFSSAVRKLLGFEEPRAVLAQAKLLVEAPAAHGLVARVYEAPAKDGGRCLFADIVAADAPVVPERMGGGWCQIGAPVRPPTEDAPPIQMMMSHAPTTRDNERTWQPPLLSGRVDPALGAERVVLEWNGGSQDLAFANDHFVVVTNVLYEPPESSLPIAVVAYDGGGTEVARQAIARDWLSLD